MRFVLWGRGASFGSVGVEIVSNWGALEEEEERELEEEQTNACRFGVVGVGGLQRRILPLSSCLTKDFSSISNFSAPRATPSSAHRKAKKETSIPRGREREDGPVKKQKTSRRYCCRWHSFFVFFDFDVDTAYLPSLLERRPC